MIIDLDMQIKIVERELAMRGYVYPKRVKDGRMSQDDADLQVAGMRAVLTTLEDLRKVRNAAAG